jgi:ABC-type transport system substrate-binding protein
MLQGSEQLDFAAQPSYLQPGVAGYEAGKAITLVRSPSWDPSTDPLRPAYVDEIDIRIAPNRKEWSPLGGTIPPTPGLAARELERLTKQVNAGRLDLIFDANALMSDVRSATPSSASNTLRYLAMNLAVPPFDDRHVRMAVNYAIEKGPLVAALDALGSEGQPATHLAPDSLEGTLLTDYDPYAHSFSKARHEMTLSRYDANSDGSCDDHACQSVTFEFQLVGTTSAQNRLISLVKADLDRIGIQIAASPSSNQSYPIDRLGLRFGDGTFAQADYPSALPFFQTLFAGGSIIGNAGFRTPNPNFSLLGANPDDLKLWGYAIHHVPTLDPWIAACQPETGESQARCWAETDQYLMQQIVPAVPLSFDQTVRVVASRIQNYSIDQFTGLPALDHLAVTG